MLVFAVVTIEAPEEAFELSFAARTLSGSAKTFATTTRSLQSD